MSFCLNCVFNNVKLENIFTQRIHLKFKFSTKHCFKQRAIYKPFILLNHPNCVNKTLPSYICKRSKSLKIPGLLRHFLAWRRDLKEKETTLKFSFLFWIGFKMAQLAKKKSARGKETNSPKWGKTISFNENWRKHGASENWFIVEKLAHLVSVEYLRPIQQILEFNFAKVG